MFILNFILVVTIFLSFALSDENYDKNGYVVYCPCMGRFGNQADHFLGALAFANGLNKTLVLPPWIEYRYGEPKSTQVPFNTYFKVEALSLKFKVKTMEYFMRSIAPTLWPENKRISFCYTHRIGEEENSCNAKSGNPFGPFWDNFDINFVGSEFYSPLNYDAQDIKMINLWKEKYPPKNWPVLAFTGAPASFPVQKENIHIHEHLKWSSNIESQSNFFIKNNIHEGGFLGIHLRNGQDWVKACQHVSDSPTLFAAPQCVGYKNERGPLTISMCLPSKSDIIKQIKRVLKKNNGIKYIFVASDSNHMIEDINKALIHLEISSLKLEKPNPHVELAILGKANFFIGNCVSSFTAFVKRERDVKGLPSEFWSYPQRKKVRHQDL